MGGVNRAGSKFVNSATFLPETCLSAEWAAPDKLRVSSVWNLILLATPRFWILLPRRGPTGLIGQRLPLWQYRRRVEGLVRR